MARFRPILAKARRSGKQLNTTSVYWAVQSWKKGFKNMIDKICYFLFGTLDKWCAWVDDILTFKKEKEKQTAPEDLFNGS